MIERRLMFVGLGFLLLGIVMVLLAIDDCLDAVRESQPLEPAE